MQVAWAGPGGRTRPHDHPLDASQREAVHRSQQWFTGEEPHPRGHGHQVMDSGIHPLILHADAHPDVGSPGQLGGQGCEPSTPFREDLERMVRTVIHHLKDLLDEPCWDFFVKQVAHGVDKDDARIPPVARRVQSGHHGVSR